MIEYLVGCLTGLLFCFVLLTAVPGSKIDKYEKAIQQCEATLPRDVKCVITAVPEVKK